jgi:hypothetical protein
LQTVPAYWRRPEAVSWLPHGLGNSSDIRAAAPKPLFRADLKREATFDVDGASAQTDW